MIRSPGLRKWARLAAGIVALGSAVALLDAAVGHAGGPFGQVWTQNRSRGINASALFYTEVGPARDFLDRSAGRYAGQESGTITPSPPPTAPPPAPLAPHAAPQAAPAASP